MNRDDADGGRRLSRRGFLYGSASAAALAPALGSAAAAKPAEAKRKIKLGLVGCGGRGSWIAGLFQKHGGYEFVAVADYFEQVADRCGQGFRGSKIQRACHVEQDSTCLSR